MYVAGLSLRVDPDGHLGPVYTQKGAYNSGQSPVPGDGASDRQGPPDLRPEPAQELYAEIQKKGVENVYSAVMFTYGLSRGFARKNVGNFEAYFGGEGKPRFANLWV